MLDLVECFADIKKCSIVIAFRLEGGANFINSFGVHLFFDISDFNLPIISAILDMVGSTLSSLYEFIWQGGFSGLKIKKVPETFQRAEKFPSFMIAFIIYVNMTNNFLDS